MRQLVHPSNTLMALWWYIILINLYVHVFLLAPYIVIEIVSAIVCTVSPFSASLKCFDRVIDMSDLSIVDGDDMWKLWLQCDKFVTNYVRVRQAHRMWWYCDAFAFTWNRCIECRWMKRNQQIKQLLFNRIDGVSNFWSKFFIYMYIHSHSRERFMSWCAYTRTHVHFYGKL